MIGALFQWCPNKNPKGPHSIGAINSSLLNAWKILRPKGPVGPAGPVMDNTALFEFANLRAKRFSRNLRVGAFVLHK